MIVPAPSTRLGLNLSVSYLIYVKVHNIKPRPEYVKDSEFPSFSFFFHHDFTFFNLKPSLSKLVIFNVTTPRKQASVVINVIYLLYCFLVH